MAMRAVRTTPDGAPVPDNHEPPSAGAFGVANHEQNVRGFDLKPYAGEDS